MICKRFRRRTRIIKPPFSLMSSSKRQQHSRFAILQTNRQIRDESLGILFSKRTLHLEIATVMDGKEFLAWADIAGECCLSVIPRLTITSRVDWENDPYMFHSENVTFDLDFKRKTFEAEQDSSRPQSQSLTKFGTDDDVEESARGGAAALDLLHEELRGLSEKDISSIRLAVAAVDQYIETMATLSFPKPARALRARAFWEDFWNGARDHQERDSNGTTARENLVDRLTRSSTEP